MISGWSHHGAERYGYHCGAYGCGGEFRLRPHPAAAQIQETTASLCRPELYIFRAAVFNGAALPFGLSDTLRGFHQDWFDPGTLSPYRRGHSRLEMENKKRMSSAELAAIITAISGFVIGTLGLIISGLTNRSAASKSELDSLRATIEILQVENKRLVTRLNDLECENKELQKRVDELERENRDLRSKTRPRGRE